MGPTVILPDLILSSRVNQRWKYSGMDSIDLCLDKDHFHSYPHNIDYAYNRQGFRDLEWPESLEELKNAVWCIGDSFTVGIGQPFEHTWPQVLSGSINQRTINISMDGASNEWISRISKKIVSTVRPKTVVILWSYFHRRENINVRLSDEMRRMHFQNSTDQQDYENFQNCFLSTVDACKSSNVLHVHGIIPNAVNILEFRHLQNSWNNIIDSTWPTQAPTTREEFNNLPGYIQEELTNKHRVFDKFGLYYSVKEFVDQHQIFSLPQLDYARDHHHFDIVTSKHFVDRIVNKLSIG